MCLRKLFCKHKKLTAFSIYEIYDPFNSKIDKQIRIVCKCDKCGKELEFEKHDIHKPKHMDVSKIIDSELWSLW